MNTKETAQQAKKQILITSSTFSSKIILSSIPPSIFLTAGGRCRGRAEGSDQANVRLAAQRAPGVEPLREGGSEGGRDGGFEKKSSQKLSVLTYELSAQFGSPSSLFLLAVELRVLLLLPSLLPPSFLPSVSSPASTLLPPSLPRYMS